MIYDTYLKTYLKYDDKVVMGSLLSAWPSGLSSTCTAVQYRLGIHIHSIANKKLPSSDKLGQLLRIFFEKLAWA